MHIHAEGETKKNISSHLAQLQLQKNIFVWFLLIVFILVVFVFHSAPNSIEIKHTNKMENQKKKIQMTYKSTN